VSDTTRSQRFADALQQLEQGEPEELLSQFAEGAELRRPEQDGVGAAADPETFWQQYRAQFSDLSTEFVRVTEVGDEGILEWRSTGTLSAGREISYAGVSLLSFDDDKAVRFATYYDTAAFVTPGD
jgi:ketosteroid isomerase-like protein